MLSSLSIHGFRGYSKSSFSLTHETAIIGASGSGKTHILEAIHMASGSGLQYGIAAREEETFLELRDLSLIGEKSFSLVRREGKDTYMIQGKKVTGMRYREELPFRTVFVSPFDMNLLYFAPSHRREYIDSILSRTFSQFSKVKREYDQTMRERNALLKSIRECVAQREDLTYWNKSFAQKAELYMLYRKKWIDFTKKHDEKVSKFLQKYTLTFFYETRLDIENGHFEEQIFTYLEEHTERDILSGHTHIGPHLDDFIFFVEREDSPPIETSTYLSRGENKLLLLALKQIEILMLRTYLEVPIVLLFDDIFAELDEKKAEDMISELDCDQVILSSQRVLPQNEKWKNFSCINTENT